VLNLIILAAGKGSRMLSQHPKVLHSIGGIPLISHVMQIARSVQGNEAGRITVVTGHGADLVDPLIHAFGARVVHQIEQLGTGHALQCGLQGLPSEGTVVVLYGDVPLVTAECLAALVKAGRESMAVMTAVVSNPSGYGRIVRDADGTLIAIVEERDATEAERAITEINSGLYAGPAELFAELLPMVANENAQGEYYLTDCIALARRHGRPVTAVKGPIESTLGVNDRVQLADLEARYQRRCRDALMRSGVTLLDPDSVFCSGEVIVGPDSVIEPQVWLSDVVIGSGVRIGMGSHLVRTQIGDAVEIKPYSLFEDARVGETAIIGPFARLRPGTELAPGTHIGNFVETKNATIGEGSKVNHLSYIGDAQIGAGVNVGAGTITCNYDGASKHQTVIGDDVFVGSNTSLVAPITVGPGATIAAGSVLTASVSEGALAIGRARQTEKAQYQRPKKSGKL